jgi:predicted DsbA family dithiol-disulfide isomerase
MMGEVEIDEEEYARLEITEVPAVVVVDEEGKTTARLEGRIEATELAKALREVARDRSRPR